MGPHDNPPNPEEGRVDELLERLARLAADLPEDRREALSELLDGEEEESRDDQRPAAGGD